MPEFIDDEDVFLRMLAKVSNHPFDIFNVENDHASLCLSMYESGKIKFDSKEEVIRMSGLSSGVTSTRTKLDYLNSNFSSGFGYA